MKRTEEQSISKKEKKRFKQKDMFSFIFLYSPIELVFISLFLFFGSYSYFWLLFKSSTTSLIFAIVTALFLFFVFSVQDRKLKQYQNNLSDLLKYINNVIFLLHSGEGVLRSLETAKESANKHIKKDIEKTIEIMRKETVLETTHFEKYNFPSLNQFHQNLSVRYERGGDARELFDSVQKRVVQELQKRDELYRKKKSLRMNIIVLMAMVFATTVILAIMTPDLWGVFLSYKTASIVTIGGYTGLGLTLLYFVQKKALDISVRL